MNLTYLDPYHIIDESKLGMTPSLMKVGVVGNADLVKFKDLYPGGTVIAYEADAKNYIKACKDNDDVYLYNMAVGVSGWIDFYTYKTEVSNSMFPRHIKDKNCVLEKTTEIESLSIDQALDHNCLTYLDVLILNCEGAEIEIMKSLYSESTRNRIGQICVSFHSPRIYPMAEKEKILNDLGKYYDIKVGQPYNGGIPDYLLVRKA